MFNLLFLVPIVGSVISVIKEALTPKVPDEYANMNLYYKDIIARVPLEQCMKNIENGKYKSTEAYQKPHRDVNSGKIVIENSKLYYDDVDKYGAWQARQWVKQGKYNLPIKVSEN